MCKSQNIKWSTLSEPLVSHFIPHSLTVLLGKVLKVQHDISQCITRNPLMGRADEELSLQPGGVAAGGGKVTNIHTFTSGCCSAQPQTLAQGHDASSSWRRGKCVLFTFHIQIFPALFSGAKPGMSWKQHNHYSDALVGIVRVNFSDFTSRA